MARKENEEKERFAKKHLEELRITREAKEAKRENIFRPLIWKSK